jgi:hypothetical protein
LAAPKFLGLEESEEKVLSERSEEKVLSERSRADTIIEIEMTSSEHKSCADKDEPHFSNISELNLGYFS